MEAGWLILVFLFEMEMRKTNVGGTRRHERAADQTLLGSGDGATEGLFYSVSDGIYFKQMMESPSRDASFVTGLGGWGGFRINQRGCQNLQRRSAIKASG